MKKQELLSMSGNLRSQFHDFSKYIESTMKLSEQRSVPTLALNSIDPILITSKPESTSRAHNKNFRLRPFSQSIDKNPPGLVNKAKMFNIDASKDNTSKTYRQKMMCQSLYEGNKTENAFSYRYLGSTTTEELEKVTEDHKEEQELNEYLQSLIIFEDMGFDLKLTYEMARSQEDINKPTNPIGFFFNIQQELKNIIKLKIGENPETVEIEIERIVDKYMGFIREMIRAMKRKNNNEEAVVLEMLWRCIVKLIDLLMEMHRNKVESLKKQHEDAFDMLDYNKNLEIHVNLELYKEKENGLKDEIARLNAFIKELKNETGYLKELLFEREKKIADLTQIDTGFEAMKSMTGLLEDLNSVINEARNHKKKQKTAILEMSEFIDAANSITTMPKIQCAYTQTDWTIKKDFLGLPKYPLPKITYHKYSALDPGSVNIEDSEIRLYFLMTLANYNPSYSFIYNFSRQAFKHFDDIQETRKGLFTISYKLKSLKEPWAEYLKTMLSLKSKIPKSIETLMDRLCQVFSKFQKPEVFEYDMPTETYLSMIDKAFRNDLKFKEYLQSTIPIRNDNQNTKKFIYQPSTPNCFFLRFSLFFEKTKLDLKQSLEKLDKQKVWEISKELFGEFLSKKLKFKFTDKEILQVWEFFKPNLENNVHLIKIYEDMQYANYLSFAKTTKVYLEDFLIVCLKYVSDLYEKTVENLKGVEGCSDVEELMKLLVGCGIEVKKENVDFLMVRVILKEKVQDLVDGFLLLPADVWKIQHQSVKKRVVKKNK